MGEIEQKNNASEKVYRWDILENGIERIIASDNITESVSTSDTNMERI